MYLQRDDIKHVFRWNSFKFTGTSNLNNDGEIGTDTSDYVIPANGTKVTVPPGDKYHFQFNQHDDEGNGAKAIFFVQSSDKNVNIDNRSIYVYSEIIQVYGKPNSTANITMTSLGSISSTVTLNFKFDDCPPGYRVDKKRNESGSSCKCANEYPDGIPGIVECDDSLYQAYITRFYWGGYYIEKHNKNVTVFVTALCPEGYCNYSKSYKSLMPKDGSELDFCSDQNRNGTTCGECMDGYSISSRSNCIKCKHGTAKGILFFILYECLPTLLFVSAILLFNVNITSGHWNALIFYFQIVENLNLYALQSPKDYPKGIATLIEIHQNVYGVWNLDFFEAIKPQTCYIQGMKNVFELNSLKYITLLFPLGLIGAIILFKNCTCFRDHCNVPICNRFQQWCVRFTNRWNGWFGETSLIHGLAAFIVVSYTRVALLSMNFFISGVLYESHTRIFEVRTHLVGTIGYFSLEHTRYLIPASFFLLIALMLPCYLILRPLCKKLCSNYGKEEQCNRCDHVICCCGCVDITKVDQLLSEFYGPFKGNYQFYAGLLFLYRLAFYATLAFTPSLQIQYCVQQCLLVAVLLIHSILQPYDEEYKFANILDALIFFNLSCINALTVYNFYSVIDIQGDSNTVVAIQLFLIYLPLFYIPCHFIWWFRRKCCTRGAVNGGQVPLRQQNYNEANDNERIHLLQQPVFDLEGERERVREMLQQYSVNTQDDYVVIEGTV